MSRDDHNDTVTSGRAVWAAAVLRQSSHTRALRPLAASVPTERSAREPGPAADRFFKPMGRDWLQHAACADADPAIFEWDEVAPFDLSPEWVPAEWYCKRCPVRGPCRAAGEGLPGMWGGRPNLIRRMDITYNGSGVHAELRDEAVTDEVTRYHGVCQAHGKRLFATRKEAKAAAKATELMHGKRRDVGPVTVYSCDENPRYHHWGHDVVKRDEIAADTRRANGKIAAMVAAAKGTTTKGDGKTMTAVAEKPSPSVMPKRPTEGVVPTASLRTVTPEMAGTWLAQNTHNRKLRKDLVSTYARDMANGNWELNGESIQIASSGLLLNGQHRLSAVVEAGVPVMMFVVTGLADSAQDTIDTGVKRGLADVLTLNGVDKGKDLAAIARFSVMVRAGTNRVRASDSELRALIDNDPTLRWVASNVLNDLPFQLASKTIMGYAYRVLHDIDMDDCATFFSKLKTLENLPQGSPILALHKRLSVMDRRCASWTDRTYVLTLIYLSWNAYRKGNELKMVKPYPSADGTYNIPKPV